MLPVPKTTSSVFCSWDGLSAVCGKTASQCLRLAVSRKLISAQGAVAAYNSSVWGQSSLHIEEAWISPNRSSVLEPIVSVFGDCLTSSDPCRRAVYEWRGLGTAGRSERVNAPARLRPSPGGALGL